MKQRFTVPFLSCAAAVICLLVAIAASPLVAAEETAATDCGNHRVGCIASRVTIAPVVISQIATPMIVPPAPPKTNGRVVTYQVETRGAITADLAQFKAQANETLNDSRGWARLGVSFQEVSSGGTFTIALAEASQMTSYSATGCDTTYSCTVGRYVIINQDRWLSATPSWNSSGGSLRDYRHMVVNHETGHWLGHGHLNCGGPGQPAPVMQQQSINLQGCTFNPWPLPSEIWSTTLGIKL